MELVDTTDTIILNDVLGQSLILLDPMSEYYIAKQGQQSGPFSKDELSAGLQNGRFAPSDLVWQSGTSDWVNLSTIFPPPLPASAPFLPEQIPANQLLATEKTKGGVGCLNILGYAFLVFIVLGVIGAMLDDSEPKSSAGATEEPLTDEQKAQQAYRKANDGNAVIAKASEGTTFQREQHEQRYLGKRYFFKGSVDDVKSDRMLTVMLDAGNHANVTFETDDVGSFKENKVVHFSAIIEAFGTGILVNHDLGEARLEDF